MIKLSVVIPVYNEEENIEFLVNELNIYFGTHQYFSAEIIFVNDGSSDRSLAKLKAARHSFYRFRIVSFSKNFGSHAAVRAGILNAQGDYITFMYADLQDPLSLINRMHDEIVKSEADIVWAWRASVQSARKEKFFSQLYAYLMRKYAVANFPEKGFDVVMFTKKVRTLLNKNIENNSSIFIQILNLGFKQSGITYNKQERQAGKSKWTLAKKIKLLIDSFVSFSFAPIRLVSMVGICFFILGISWSIYIIARKLIYDDLASGWPALISILTVGFGITNISLGILAEYLWRTLDASRNRPVFVIDEIVDGFQNEDHLETENYYQLNEGL